MFETSGHLNLTTTDTKSRHSSTKKYTEPGHLIRSLSGRAFLCLVVSMIYFCLYFFGGASLVAQTVKRLPAIWNTWVRSLGQEDPLEKEMATHSSTFAWKIPWTEEPGRLHGVTKSRTRLSDFTSLLFLGDSLMTQW